MAIDWITSQYITYCLETGNTYIFITNKYISIFRIFCNSETHRIAKS